MNNYPQTDTIKTPDFQILEKRMMDNNEAMHNLLLRLEVVANRMKPREPSVAKSGDSIRGDGFVGSYNYEQQLFEDQLGWMESMVRHLETLV